MERTDRKNYNIRQNRYCEGAKIVWGSIWSIQPAGNRALGITTCGSILNEEYWNNRLHIHEQHTNDKKHPGGNHEIQQDLSYGTYRDNGCVRVWGCVRSNNSGRVLQGQTELRSCWEMRVSLGINRSSLLSGQCLSHDKVFRQCDVIEFPQVLWAKNYRAASRNCLGSQYRRNLNGSCPRKSSRCR